MKAFSTNINKNWKKWQITMKKYYKLLDKCSKMLKKLEKMKRGMTIMTSLLAILLRI